MKKLIWSVLLVVMFMLVRVVYSEDFKCPDPKVDGVCRCYLIMRMDYTKAEILKLRGEPNRMHRTVTKYGVHEQWVYECYQRNIYIYFENGILTAWQD